MLEVRAPQVAAMLVAKKADASERFGSEDGKELFGVNSVTRMGRLIEFKSHMGSNILSNS